MNPEQEQAEAEPIEPPVAEPVEIEKEPEPQEPPAPEWTEQDEATARKFKWKSPDEWQGDKPPGYIENPKEYVERIERHPIYQTLSDDLQKLQEEQAEAIKKMNAVNDRIHKEQAERHKAEIARLSAAREKAYQDGDLDAYKQLSEEREALTPLEPQQEQPQQGQYKAFMDAYGQTPEGAWIHNPILRDAAAQIVQARADLAGAPGQAQADYARGELKKLYPAYFDDPKPQQPAPPRTSRVDGGGIGGGNSGQTAFDKLPADAKAQFKIEVSRGTFKDDKKGRETYAEYYNEA